jgi:predicted nucleic acid-binding protein
MEKKTFKVFLDSGVILSGLTSERGAPRLILDILGLGLPVLRGVTGRCALTEIERNIARKLPAALMVLDEHLPKLDLEIVFLPFFDELAPFRGVVDDKDLPVLASAALAHADYFLTGDKRLLARIERAAGLSFRGSAPADFLGQVLPEVLAGRDPHKEDR